MSASDPRPSALEARLERVERALAAISSEVAAIRAELHAPATDSSVGGPSPVTPSDWASSEPRRERRRAPASALDVEKLVGRYGMLAIAVLAAVAAVGTFLSWAIRNGYLLLGPEARVLIGLGAAAGLGWWGLRLRVRERSFGSSILGLALVIVQVCAYAAGPAFHLVPSWVAFAGAAFLSWALALFAHAENDEPLWCVGFGGAALAPFVTSERTGNIYAFLAYALVVLLPGCFAISGRVWPVAWRVFYAVSALFTIVGADVAHRTSTVAFMGALALPFVVAGAGVVPFAPVERKRAALRWLGILGALASSWTPVLFTREGWALAGGILALMGFWLFVLDRQAFLPQSSLLRRYRDSAVLLDWIDAAAIPLTLVYAATTAMRGSTNPVPVFAAAVPLFGLFTWRRAVNPLRDAGAFATMACAAGVVAGVPLEEPLGRGIAFVALALVILAMHRLRPSVSWLAGGLFILGASVVASISMLTDRRAYSFTPFVTEESATALVVLLGLVGAARFWQALRVATREAMGDRPEWSYAARARLLVRGVNVAPWIWAFVWATIELAMAYSPSTATLLLVTYFAATAVGCVGVGRARRSARLRQVGLALAVVAAGTAFYGATSYFDFGARIIAYLVTSAFLLGIAYWYRRPGGLETAQDATA